MLQRFVRLLGGQVNHVTSTNILSKSVQDPKQELHLILMQKLLVLASL